MQLISKYNLFSKITSEGSKVSGYLKQKMGFGMVGHLKCFSYFFHYNESKRGMVSSRIPFSLDIFNLFLTDVKAHSYLKLSLLLAYLDQFLLTQYQPAKNAKFYFFMIVWQPFYFLFS